MEVIRLQIMLAIMQMKTHKSILFCIYISTKYNLENTDKKKERKKIYTVNNYFARSLYIFKTFLIKRKLTVKQITI